MDNEDISKASFGEQLGVHAKALKNFSLLIMPLITETHWIVIAIDLDRKELIIYDPDRRTDEEFYATIFERIILIMKNMFAATPDGCQQNFEKFSHHIDVSG